MSHEFKNKICTSTSNNNKNIIFSEMKNISSSINNRSISSKSISSTSISISRDNEKHRRIEEIIKKRIPTNNLSFFIKK